MVELKQHYAVFLYLKEHIAGKKKKHPGDMMEFNMGCRSKNIDRRILYQWHQIV